MSDSKSSPIDNGEHTEAINALVKEFDEKGVGVKLVADGAIFMFKREYLQALLDSMPNQKSFMMYIRRPGVN